MPLLRKTEPAIQLGAGLSQGGRYDDKDQHRGDALQSPNEQTAENADPAGIGNQKRKHRAQCQTDEDPDTM